MGTLRLLGALLRAWGGQDRLPPPAVAAERRLHFGAGDVAAMRAASGATGRTLAPRGRVAGRRAPAAAVLVAVLTGP